ncbi:MAG TPA: ABC transporter substrate-binding protein [Rhizomicrobium sp.]|nr:ABC transporter substrate-binding protein [Rhizomicrobium sp.]
MRRREFLGGIGAATAWPVVARGQQADRVRRIGLLMNLNSDDPLGQVRQKSFEQELQERGWELGRNLQIDIRWAGGVSDRDRRYAGELVALKPDVLVAVTAPVVSALQKATSTIPIVFVSVLDPVAAGFVASLARPGGNVTGFSLFEYGLSGKWLALLKEIAPTVTRAAILRDPGIASGSGQLGAIQSVAPSLGMELSMVAINAADIDRAVATFAQGGNGGLIVTASPFGAAHSALITEIAARHRLPAVYPFRYFVEAGGLTSYGPDGTSEFRPAAAYVDRILRGAKPADLPVQTPTQYELWVNLKTAKVLGLTAPPTLLARADQVIE